MQNKTQQYMQAIRHGVKVGQKPQDRDPGRPLKFKSGTQDPLQSLKIFSTKYMFEMVPTKEYRKNLRKTFTFTH